MVLSGRKWTLVPLAASTAPSCAACWSGSPLRVVLLPGKAVAPDLDVELLRERVDAADADAVQAARDLVVRRVELAARVQHGEHDLHGRHLLAVDDLVVDRNAAAVVDHGDGVVDVDGDIDARRVSAQRLVDRVVDDLIHQVVQAHLAGGADVHGRAQPDRRQPLEHGDIFSGVAAALSCACGRGCCVGCTSSRAASGLIAVDAIHTPCGA